MLSIKFEGDEKRYRFVASETVPYLASVRAMADLRGHRVSDIQFPNEAEFFGDDHTLPIDPIPA